MLKRGSLLALLALVVFATSILAQPRPQIFPIHAAEAGNVAGTVISTFGYPSVTVDNSIAAAWDGTLNYEGNFPSIGWIALQCRNQATNLVVTTTTGAASVICNITGAQQFRARVTGRTVGTVTATAAIMAGGESGVGAVTVDDTLVDDTAFTIATDRVFPVGYLVDDVASDTADEGDIGAARMSPTRVLRMTPGNDAGTPVTYGAGAIAATTLRVTIATDDEINDDLDNIRIAVETLDNIAHTRNEAFGESAAVGGELDDTAPVVATEGNVSPVRITAQRAFHSNLRNNAGTEVGTATDPVRVDPIGTTTQPVSITAANFPDNEPFNLAQVAGTATATGNGVVGAGVQRVAVASDNTAFTVNIGTFPDNEPFNLNQLAGTALAVPFDVDTGAGTQNIAGVSLRKAAAGGSVEYGTATDPLRTDPTGTTTQPVSGTVTIGTFPDNEPFNVAQFGGAAVVTGTGASGAGIPRVTVSSDSSLAANQSVNVSQINGATPLMGTGVSGTGSPRVTIASDGNVVDTELPAAAALADNTANPTAPAVGAFLMCWDGATWDRCPGTSAGGQYIQGPAADGAAVVGNPARIAGKDAGGLTQDIATTASGLVRVSPTEAFTAADAVVNTTIVRQFDSNEGAGPLATACWHFNGTTWDRCRSGSATSTQPHYASALVHRAGGAFTFLASTTHAATTVLAAQAGLGGFNNLVVTWDVTAAERDSANETYDLYVTCGDGVSTWDVAHFPQIITTGAKRYTAFIHGQLLNQNVTTAVPGVAANDPGTFKTDTGGADQGTRTLAAGVIRHGALGDRCGADIVIAGTIVTGITHSVTMTVKP